MINKSQYSKIVELKEVTGYEKVECLRALKSTNWDIENAVKYLKDNPPVCFEEKCPKELILIGFWKSEDEKEWPDPAWFVDYNWDQQVRRYVIWYLKSGAVLSASAGYSWCRFRCKQRTVGSLTMTDGTYIWPEGYSYLSPTTNGKLILYPNDERVTAETIRYLKKFECCNELSTQEILEKLRQKNAIILQRNFDYYEFFEVESKAKDLKIDICFEFGD